MDIFVRGLKAIFNPARVTGELKTLRSKEKIVLLMMIAGLTIAYFINPQAMGVLGLFTGIVTVINMVLIDRGRLTNFFWGIGSCVGWVIIASQNRLYGDVAAQSFHLLMQFVGVYAWEKSLEKEHSDEIEPKKLSPQLVIIAVGLTIALYFGMVYVSMKANGNLVWLSAAILPLSLLAQILMTYGYRSQWFAWLAVNSTNILIWSIRMSHGGSSALSMILLNAMMFIISAYGLYIWYGGGKGHDHN